jgi:hypothetical protein
MNTHDEEREDAATAKIEATERLAGVAVGSWRYVDASTWIAGIQRGLRARVALDERRLKQAY